MSPQPTPRHLCAALCLALALPCGHARAAPPKADTDAAARSFASGTKLFEQRKYVSAAAAFERAYKLRPHFRVLCSIARCYENLNQMVRAADYYRRCLADGGERTPMAARVAESLKAVESQLTWLTVESPGPGGTVFINGEAAGAAPRRVPLDPGNHVIEVRREGARPASVTIRTLGGEKRTVTLRPVDLGRSAAPDDDLAPAAVETADRPRTSRGLSPALFWTGAVVTAALTATVAVLGIQTLGLKSDYEKTPSEAGLDEFKSRRTVTNVFFAAAAVAGAATTVTFFFTDFDGHPSAGRTETAGRSFGVVARGSF